MRKNQRKSKKTSSKTRKPSKTSRFISTSDSRKFDDENKNPYDRIERENKAFASIMNSVLEKLRDQKYNTQLLFFIKHGMVLKFANAQVQNHLN